MVLKNIYIWGEATSLEDLEKDITEDELKFTIKGLAQEKTPVDDFPQLFYNKYWKVIRDDMMGQTTEINQSIARLD